ncbi:MAG: hypothetical protein ACFCD0_03315 [Gemmataceae bacterium]
MVQSTYLVTYGKNNGVFSTEFEAVFEKFCDKAPMDTMNQMNFDQFLDAQTMDTIFDDNAQDQYTRKLLFSSCVDVMALLAFRIEKSVQSSCKHLQEKIDATLKCLYEKLARIEQRIDRCTGGNGWGSRPRRHRRGVLLDVYGSGSRERLRRHHDCIAEEFWERFESMHEDEFISLLVKIARGRSHKSIKRVVASRRRKSKR